MAIHGMKAIGTGLSPFQGEDQSFFHTEGIEAKISGVMEVYLHRELP
jgi:hypothetical protein